MAAVTQIDAYNARVREGLIRPFKRRMASLTIRSDIWSELLNVASTPADGRQHARTLALDAIVELDTQVSQLADLKLPGEKKARDSEAEVKSLLDAFAAMRLMLVGMTSKAVAA